MKAFRKAGWLGKIRSSCSQSSAETASSCTKLQALPGQSCQTPGKDSGYTSIYGFSFLDLFVGMENKSSQKEHMSLLSNRGLINPLVIGINKKKEK